MSTFNPYEAPQSAFAAIEVEDDRSGPWRDGNELVARCNSQLPPRCFRCNEPVFGLLKERTYSWHNGALYLLILLNILLYAIVAMIVRKRTRLRAGLCERHYRQRQKLMFAAWGSFVLSIALFIFSASYGDDMEPLLIFSIILVLVAMVLGASASWKLRPERIGKQHARFKGCGKEFLNTLPRFRGPEY